MKWPLADNNYSLIDRLKICSFFLNKKNRWTQDKYVKEYENKIAKYVGCKYAIFLSSGSTANQLLCQYIKDDLIKKGEWPKKNKVIVGAVTWQTNVSPWIREGYEPIFIDVNLNDFCFDYIKLEQYIQKNKDTIACVFPTSVLGFTCDIKKLEDIQNTYKVRVMLDACENFYGEFDYKNICSFFTSTTSTFIAHHITNGCEGGFIFTNNQEEYEYFLLARAHGLLRNYKSYNIKTDGVHNKLVDEQFDFQILSSNYRNTDIGAYLGILDWKRIDYYKSRRIDLYLLFNSLINKEKYYLPPIQEEKLDVAFCLPIISKHSKSKEIKDLLRANGIECRSFISGNMLRQLPYQQYGDYKDYSNAEYLNNNAIYCGLRPDIKEYEIEELCEILNNI